MSERRRYPPFISWLPFRLTGVAGSKIELSAVTLLTQNISKSGAWFLAPRRIEPGQSIEVEAILAGMGPGGKDVYMAAAGYIVRVESCDEPGWYKLAAALGEPPAGDEPGWHKLVAEFEELPSPSTNS